jgi:sterol 14-demethylase
LQFILGVLFAGIVNTGIMSAWMLLFLHNTPAWKAKAIAEVQSFISQYAPKDDPNLAAQLAAIPPEVWDDNMLVLDLCLRETIRIVMTGAALRRVMTNDVVVDGVKIERGSFLAFLMSSTHADPEIYDEPERRVNTT